MYKIYIPFVVSAQFKFVLFMEFLRNVSTHCSIHSKYLNNGLFVHIEEIFQFCKNGL